MMFAKPQQEHQWLDQLIGDWTAESKCQLPGQEPQEATGRMTCRTMGGLWLVMEGDGGSPDEEGGEWSSLMTLGFEPAKSRFVGTFVASMMDHLWVYQGELDPANNRLVLTVEGPSLDGSGVSKYHDSITVKDPDHWTLTSAVLDEDGKVEQFMSADHYRLKVDK